MDQSIDVISSHHRHHQSGGHVGPARNLPRAESERLDSCSFQEIPDEVDHTGLCLWPSALNRKCLGLAGDPCSPFGVATSDRYQLLGKVLCVARPRCGSDTSNERACVCDGKSVSLLSQLVAPLGLAFSPFCVFICAEFLPVQRMAGA